MRTERLTFPGAFGDALAARLDRPEKGAPVAYALFAHCFTCSKDYKAVSRISRALTRLGFGLLRFDFTGLGESAGNFSETQFSSNLDDLRAAIRYLLENGMPPRLLIGHSLGGAAALVVASEFEDVRAVATIGAPSETGTLRAHLLSVAPEVLQRGEAEIQLAGRPFRIRQQLLDDLEENRILLAVRNLGRPLLIMHSPVDDTVSIDHARRLFQAAEHPKSFISLDDSDHLLQSRPDDARYAAEVLAAWSSRYLS